MWETLVIVLRLPLSMVWLCLLVFVWTPLFVAFFVLLLLWAVITLPFVLAKEVIANNREGAVSYIKEFESFSELIGILMGSYRSWWIWTNGGAS
jgi:hypothetical protein